MASSVFYKFSSQKNESRVTFDGTGISVFDLKREIILANNMGKANDFDLYVYDAATKQEYKDDSTIIPRSSSVVVKRLPASRPGRGKASMYISGAAPALPTSEPVQRSGSSAPTWHKGAMSKRFDGKEEMPSSSIPPMNPITKSSTPQPVLSNNITKEDEAAAMAAMFQAQTANWEETQEKMSHAQRIHRGGTAAQRGGKTFTPQDRPLPPSYVCYRCGKKGHWIQDCPTNNDREFDNRPRIKRTTGIPRSMLKAVENPNGDIGQGVMVTPEGGYVVAQPDLASWQKQVSSRPKGLTAAEVRERPPTDPSLACPIDNKLFRDAVKTPCCGKHYCEECIQTHLLERDFICPNCSKKVPSLDKLIVDKPTRTKVADYIERAIEDSKREGAEDQGGRIGELNQSIGTPDGISGDQDNLYSETQPDPTLADMNQVVDSIPQLQAQISQLSIMLQNPSLPNQVRMQTEMQFQQLQFQLNNAQNFAAALAAATSLQQQVAAAANFNMNMNAGMGGMGMGGGVAGPSGGVYPNQQQPGPDSAYQRLPVNNRRKNLKRERPSDFLEVGGEDKRRHWE
ncbi:DWNN-domain-containing protein [Macrolepiota fuliginosa MF-IS2]|uniref:DWNN-domain-containing protein n=1 Tax=Macrolepiota fuliginosa MF-IS2 TaxID=1400762 RepID=A0A9P5XRE2_9AGAR|nr:DWNN-domain-containing protein [Macrolepiota fuliginosa MF-IS2]